MTFKLVVAVSVDAGTEIDGEEEGFATGTTKVSNFGAEKCSQTSSFCGHFLS